MKNKYFKYTQKEIDYLKSKDRELGRIIDKIGMIKRPVIDDLFKALMHTIVGQQISTKAQASVFDKIEKNLPAIDSSTIATVDPGFLQSLGLSFRKVEYMQDIAKKIEEGSLQLNNLYVMSDEEVLKELTKLRGIGIWSAQMLMIFSMQRPNILSYDDLAIQRGLRMIYHHRTITPKLHQKYFRRYSPYATVASLYIWEVAGGKTKNL